MNKKLKFLVLALCAAPAAMAQTVDSLSIQGMQDEQAFTFTEAQLGEDDDMSANVTITGSNSNVYASQVGYLFSPMRFRYRAFNQKYNDIYINGVQMNDMETGQFRYSLVGGLNQQTRGVENSLPFEDNNFAMSALGGSNNYNFRPSAFATGHRITLSGANRNYTLRGMYTYNSGVMENGWAFSANLTYRWANPKTAYVDGTFYNALSYFFGAEKFINEQHHLSFVTWGNPTERASQGAATDEMYWLANDRYYNPYWGYQNGHIRNSRVVNDFAPTAMMTWDWKINDQMKLVTTLTGRYSMYKNTRLNYNNSDNPHPNYWKNLPSSYYDVWYEADEANRTEAGMSDWLRAKNFLSGYKADRQINFDKLYYANKQANVQGADAMYYIQAKHNDNLNISLASNLNVELTKNQHLTIGMQLATNKGMHYQTMDDLLGANSYHNINTYALGSYSMLDPEVQYDANNPNAKVREGDRFGYDYNIMVDKASFWTTYSINTNNTHAFVSGRIGGVEMQRDGKMRNGMFLENSYGKSKTAHFLEGGGKVGAVVNLGHGHTINGGLGVDVRAPQAQAAFVSPEMNNDFVVDLKNEKNYSAEIGYQMQNSWLKANIMAYGAIVTDVTEWQNFYFDDINSFSYVSMTGIDKEYYGVEWGLNFKLTDAINVKTIGTVSEARNTNNAQVWYMNSTKGTFNDANGNQPEIVYNKDMREAGTPLTALSLILSYHKSGWFIDLSGNYYDRIYLSYSPSYRYQSTLDRRSRLDFEPVYETGTTTPLESAVAQAKGKGGFMLDLSIGRSLYLKHGRSMSINLMITNLLNNQSIVTGGYEQSRSSYTASDNIRAYQFQKNPFKYYAYGINGMLNIAYKF
ncbi:MAG: TonB-dependent receptor [Prevotella sp.]|nr:TonB-dependent receptor [Prevotella sp.]